MKRLIFLTTFLLLCTISVAQNIQVLYDFGGNIYKGLDKRPTVTTTAEMFRADKFGSTYISIDLDYNKQVTGAYWEIAREFCFWQNSRMDWLSIHAEYNGGCTTTGSFNNSWLAGLTYSGHSKDYSKTWSLSAMYKLIPGTKKSIGVLENRIYTISRLPEHGALTLPTAGSPIRDSSISGANTTLCYRNHTFCSQKSSYGST